MEIRKKSHCSTEWARKFSINSVFIHKIKLTIPLFAMKESQTSLCVTEKESCVVCTVYAHPTMTRPRVLHYMRRVR